MLGPIKAPSSAAMTVASRGNFCRYACPLSPWGHWSLDLSDRRLANSRLTSRSRIFPEGTTMMVDLVNVTTRDGIRLDGTWRKPSVQRASQLGVDVVILHHGVGGNFYSPGMFEQYSDGRLEQGCAVLRVNNRGHDPMSRAIVGEDVKRLGAAYEDMQDCTYDWEAW